MKKNHYEVLFVLRPLPVEQLDNIVESYRGMITQQGDIHRFENCWIEAVRHILLRI